MDILCTAKKELLANKTKSATNSSLKVFHLQQKAAKVFNKTSSIKTSVSGEKLKKKLLSQLRNWEVLMYVFQLILMLFLSKKACFLEKPWADYNFFLSESFQKMNVTFFAFKPTRQKFLYNTLS